MPGSIEIDRKSISIEPAVSTSTTTRLARELETLVRNTMTGNSTAAATISDVAEFLGKMQQLHTTVLLPTTFFLLDPFAKADEFEA